MHESDLTLADWVGVAPKGATLKKSAALNRGVVSAIYRGEPVTENRLAPSGSGGGLAATIPAGMRACAIKVNEVVGVAGFVIPGDARGRADHWQPDRRGSGRGSEGEDPAAEHSGVIGRG